MGGPIKPSNKVCWTCGYWPFCCQLHPAKVLKCRKLGLDERHCLGKEIKTQILFPLKLTNRVCWMCEWVGHLSAYCTLQNCWHCWEPGHDKRYCPVWVEDPGNRFLLPAPLAWLAWNWKGKRAQVYFLHTEEREITCKVRMGNRSARVLIDTGAAMSLIQINTPAKLRIVSWMRRPNLVKDQAVEGD